MSSYLHNGDVVATVSDDSAGGGSVVVLILVSKVDLSSKRRGFVHTLLQMLYPAMVHPEYVSKGCFANLFRWLVSILAFAVMRLTRRPNALMVSLGLCCMFITASIVAMRFFCDV